MMHGIVHSIMAGLFGSSLLPEDKLLVLRLLRYLTELQLVPSENPRRYVLCFKEINLQKAVLDKRTAVMHLETIGQLTSTILKYIPSK
jgi:hypothetical protein